MKLISLLEEAFDTDQEIEHAMRGIATLDELTDSLRKRIHYLLNNYMVSYTKDDYEIRQMIRKADSQEKLAIRVALKVYGRKDPTDEHYPS